MLSLPEICLKVLQKVKVNILMVIRMSFSFLKKIKSNILETCFSDISILIHSETNLNQFNKSFKIHLTFSWFTKINLIPPSQSSYLVFLNIEYFKSMGTYMAKGYCSMQFKISTVKCLTNILCIRTLRFQSQNGKFLKVTSLLLVLINFHH